MLSTAVLAVSGVLVPLAAAGTPAPATSLTAQVVPGTVSLTGVACSSSTTCEAVGQNSSEGVVVPITNGIPGTAVGVPGTISLTGVACSSATTCEAVGEQASSYEGVVVPITNGAPGSAVTVGFVSGDNPIDLPGVGCSSSTTCVAVGTSDDNSDEGSGVVVRITNGAPGSPLEVLGTYLLSGFACFSSTCEAVGQNSGFQGGGEGAVVPIQTGQSVPVAVNDNAAQTAPGGTLTFTAAVNGSGGVTPTGNLTWSVTDPNNNPVSCDSTTGPSGSGNTATYTCSINDVLEGSYVAIAKYLGDSNYPASSGTDTAESTAPRPPSQARTTRHRTRRSPVPRSVSR